MIKTDLFPQGKMAFSFASPTLLRFLQVPVCGRVCTVDGYCPLPNRNIKVFFLVKKSIIIVHVAPSGKKV